MLKLPHGYTTFRVSCKIAHRELQGVSRRRWKSSNSLCSAGGQHTLACTHGYEYMYVCTDSDICLSSIYVSACLPKPFYPSIYLSFYLSVYLSIYLSAYLSIHLPIDIDVSISGSQFYQNLILPLCRANRHPPTATNLKTSPKGVDNMPVSGAFRSYVKLYGL